MNLMHFNLLDPRETYIAPLKKVSEHIPLDAYKSKT